MSPFVESLRRKYLIKKVTMEKLGQYLIDEYITNEEYNLIVEV